MRKYHSFLCLLCISALFQSTASGQLFKLLKDINESPWWSSTVGPRNMTAGNDLLFFKQDTGLWRTDGTEAGTVFLKRITPKTMVNVNGTIFISGGTIFTWTAPGSGHFENLSGLWKSDGTPDGTVQVSPVEGAGNMTAVGDMLYFSTYDGQGKHELWRSDGTGAGTNMIRDFFVTNVTAFTSLNGALYFNVGNDLWKSDGTAIGTTLVKASTILSHQLVTPGGVLYFVNNSNQLWKSDGTDAGTSFITNITSAATVDFPYPQLTYSNGSVYFIGNTGTPATSLWKTDGTAAGTVPVKDVNGIESLVNANDMLFFSVSDGFDGGALWKSDGTAAGTTLLKNNISPAFLTSVNGLLLFSGSDTPHGYELWKSDGTEAGTTMLKDIYNGNVSSFPFSTDARATEPPAGLGYGVVNNTLFFSAANGINGRELWKSNGTVGSTVMVKDIYRPNVSSNARFFTNVNGIVYFTAFDRFSSPFLFYADELYKTDGTLSGTQMVRDLYSLGSGLPTNLTSFQNQVYFSANDGMGTDLFKSDGTYDGTARVKNINPVNGKNADPSSLTPINNQLFFSANDGTNGTELWRSDGTETGTVIVKNINPAGPGNPANLINLNGTLFFTADDGTSGNELWKSDGTETGTVMVKNINAGTGSDISWLTNVNGTLYFAANDGVNGKELWKSDGTEAGTVLIKNIRAGTDSDPSFLTNVNGVLYFSADDGINGRELWKSDGTGAGTVLVHDIRAGAEGSNPANFINLNGTLYFSANDGVSGTELWKSNGNTLLVKDINPGAAGSDPSVLTRIGNNILFAANDGTAGNEIWLTNGSEAGTRLMQDIEPGAPGSDPTEFIEVNGKVLASVFTSYWGREAWVADVPAESPLPLQLLEFKGAIVNNDGVLKWKTDNEYNTSSFVVERSTDGRSYSAIGSVSSANTAGVHYYDYTDRDIMSLGSPILYYRLKQVDIDGHYEYSTIVALAITGNKNFVVLYPNPVRDKVNLAISVAVPEKLNWKVTDSYGRLVQSGVYQLAAGSSAVSIDASKWTKGMYLLQLRGANLDETMKLLKQ